MTHASTTRFYFYQQPEIPSNARQRQELTFFSKKNASEWHVVTKKRRKKD